MLNGTEIKRRVLPDQKKKNEFESEDDGFETPSAGKPMNSTNEIQERLGFGLRSMYRNVLEEPLPADMMALLDQLDENENLDDSKSDAGSTSSE
ncbi:NepR family anti-sigma factor [Parasphingorhabdus cellanae]|uniref:Anti-sigma factor NepR domain-containing protein n=1 Tax=Parasphingorhabdus cellanae TaxID=2806553 RepID=A0ABX7T994_9SPHN|nr:NepR family anti-sigma factor [Parasphingorhabdus cellanae]QTD57382.1 hypothetical protein J4G78_07610 [Parasphingorhabdus cellanae]